MSHQLVNVSRNLSPLNMGKRNIEIGCRNRRRHRLISISDSHHHIRPDILKDRGQFYNTKTCGFGLCFQIFTLYHIINLSGGCKSVFFNYTERIPETIQQNGCPYNKLQFQIRVRLYRFQYIFYPAIISPARHYHTYFSLHAKPRIPFLFFRTAALQVRPVQRPSHL